MLFIGMHYSYSFDIILQRTHNLLSATIPLNLTGRC